jgi:hypothetical protein
MDDIVHLAKRCAMRAIKAWLSRAWAVFRWILVHAYCTGIPGSFIVAMVGTVAYYYATPYLWNDTTWWIFRILAVVVYGSYLSVFLANAVEAGIELGSEWYRTRQLANKLNTTVQASLPFDPAVDLFDAHVVYVDGIPALAINVDGFSRVRVRITPDLCKSIQRTVNNRKEMAIPRSRPINVTELPKDMVTFHCHEEGQTGAVLGCGSRVTFTNGADSYLITAYHVWKGLRETGVDIVMRARNKTMKVDFEALRPFAISAPYDFVLIKLPESTWSQLEVKPIGVMKHAKQLTSVRVYGVLNGRPTMTCGIVKSYPLTPGKVLHTATTKPSFSGTLIRAGDLAVALHLGSADEIYGENNQGLDLELVRRLVDPAYRSTRRKKESSEDVSADVLTRFMSLDAFEALDSSERRNFAQMCRRLERQEEEEVRVQEEKMRVWCSNHGIFIEIMDDFEAEFSEHDYDSDDFPDDFYLKGTIWEEDRDYNNYRQRKEMRRDTGPKRSGPPKSNNGAGHSKKSTKGKEPLEPVITVSSSDESDVAEPLVRKSHKKKKKKKTQAEKPVVEGKSEPVVVNVHITTPANQFASGPSCDRSTPVKVEAEKPKTTTTQKPASTGSQPQKEALKEKDVAKPPVVTKIQKEDICKPSTPLVNTNGTKAPSKETSSNIGTAAKQPSLSKGDKPRQNRKEFRLQGSHSLSSKSGHGQHAEPKLKEPLSTSK